MDTARVEILDGPRAGEVVTAFMEGPGGSQLIADYQPGDEVVLTITQQANDPEPYIAVVDHWRIVPLQLLAALFAVAVVVVGGWRGVRALVALGLTIAVILRILLPLILRGVPPLPLAVVGATAITAATILLTEGRSRAALAAILGTAGALSVAGLLASVVTAAAQFTYTSSDLAFVVTQGGAGLDLRGILLAAIILGAVGVLDDVTVTQAVVVDELAERGAMGGRALFWSALGIGRSHIGATVNTLFLAYVGASLPLLVVLLIQRAPGALVWNNEEIATEIVRTLAGSLGIIAAVPLTTFIAVALVGALRPVPAAQDGSGDAQAPAAPGGSLVPVAAIAGVVVLLLAATALLPITQRDRAPLPTEPPYQPGSSAYPVASDKGLGPLDSGDPAAGGEPVLAARGEPVAIAVADAEVGTVTVQRWAITDTAGTHAATVKVSYAATADWPPDPAAWELLTADGTSVPLTADAPLPETIAAGTTLEVTLRATTELDLAGGFVAYLDPEAASFVFLVPLD